VINHVPLASMALHVPINVLAKTMPIATRFRVGACAWPVSLAWTAVAPVLRVHLDRIADRCVTVKMRPGVTHSQVHVVVGTTIPVRNARLVVSAILIRQFTYEVNLPPKLLYDFNI